MSERYFFNNAHRMQHLCVGHFIEVLCEYTIIQEKKFKLHFKYMYFALFKQCPFDFIIIQRNSFQSFWKIFFDVCFTHSFKLFSCQPFDIVLIHICF